MEERNSTNQTTTQYVWSPVYVDAMVLRDKDNNADGDVTDVGERHYAAYDANFNITALTDSSGNVVERYLYDPYGQQTVLDADWTLDADNTTDHAFTHLVQRAITCAMVKMTGHSTMSSKRLVSQRRCSRGSTCGFFNTSPGARSGERHRSKSR